MPEKSSNPFYFWQELKRRKVIRVITVYAAAAFVIIEVANNVSESLNLPDWLSKWITIILGIGLLLVIIFSWIFDITPEGIEKTKSRQDIQTREKPSTSNAWKLATYVSMVVITVLLALNITGNRKAKQISELEKSIAVLPFDNMSDGDKYVHMGDAITDELILELQKIKEFDRVLSRSSTMQFKDSRPTIPEMGEKLGVNYMIEGSIQRYDEDVSIRVQVIRVQHEDHVWAEEYNGKWKDIFSIQNEIAFNVANELKTVLSDEEVKQIEKDPTENLEAYNLYLKGRWFWNKWTDDDIRRGMEFFEQAIELDPEYALAYAGLAEAYNTLSFYGQLHPNETYPRAKELAKKALVIDNTLAEAHCALAFVLVYYDWDWKRGEQEFRKAIELDPNYVTAHHLYAYYLVLQTRYDEAITEINKALMLEPMNLITNRTLGDFYYHSREYDKAMEQLIKTLEMDSGFTFAHAYLGLVYLQKSLCEKAVSELQKEYDLDKGTKDIALAWKGYAYGICGNNTKVYEILDSLNHLALRKHIPSSYFSWIYFALGETDKGFEWLEKAYNARDPWLTEIKNNHFYDPVHSDPRYVELLEKMNLNE